MGNVQFLLSNKCLQWLSMTIPIVSHNFKITLNCQVIRDIHTSDFCFVFRFISCHFLYLLITKNVNIILPYLTITLYGHIVHANCPEPQKARAVKFICMYLVKGFMDITIKLISHYFKKVF